MEQHMADAWLGMIEAVNNHVLRPDSPSTKRTQELPKWLEMTHIIWNFLKK